MKCSTVQILQSGINELNGDRVIRSIPREDILRITLSHDSRARHPFLQFLVGFVLLVSGFILSIAAFLIDEAGIYLVRLQSQTFGIPVVPIMLVLMIWLGGWLLAGVLRGRYNLLIYSNQGLRKIFFDESAKINQIAQFVERAQLELGYHIDVSLLKQMHF